MLSKATKNSTRPNNTAPKINLQEPPRKMHAMLIISIYLQHLSRLRNLFMSNSQGRISITKHPELNQKNLRIKPKKVNLKWEKVKYRHSESPRINSIMAEMHY